MDGWVNGWMAELRMDWGVDGWLNGWMAELRMDVGEWMDG